MKTNLLFLALMGATLITPTMALAMPYHGETKQCKSTLANPCSGNHADSLDGFSEYPDANSQYQSIQWIGTASQCTKSSSQTCSVDFTKTTTGTTTWKVGIKVAITGQVEGVGSLVAEANAEYSVARTDTDTVGQTQKVRGGNTIVPYSFVPRKKYHRSYFGVWVKGPRYKCGAFGAYNCYNYTFNAFLSGLDMTYYRSLENFQTITFKTFPNGSLSGLKLEDDN